MYVFSIIIIIIVFQKNDRLYQHMYEYLRFFRLYRNRPISAFAGAVMELSYLEDWKMAKGVIIPICEAGKLFL